MSDTFRLTLQTKILLNELKDSPKTPYELREKTRYFSTNIYSVLARLVKYEIIMKNGNKYCLTEKGVKYL
jgi:predicted transcriptional regulator